jgi:hypothetical protein
MARWKTGKKFFVKQQMFRIKIFLQFRRSGRKLASNRALSFSPRPAPRRALQPSSTPLSKIWKLVSHSRDCKETRGGRGPLGTGIATSDVQEG